MLILSWLLGLTILISVATQSVIFHHNMVCRQKAWLTTVELSTQMLLTTPTRYDQRGIPGCKIMATRKDFQTSWSRFPFNKKHLTELHLGGKL